MQVICNSRRQIQNMFNSYIFIHFTMYVERTIKINLFLSMN